MGKLFALILFFNKYFYCDIAVNKNKNDRHRATAKRYYLEIKANIIKVSHTHQFYKYKTNLICSGQKSK